MTPLSNRGVFTSVRPDGGSRLAFAWNLTNATAAELGLSIVRGEFSKTNPFPNEGELCKRYGVSRSILREAVKMLTAKGLVGARPRRGAFVQPEDQWNLLDPDVLRLLLECKVSLDVLIEFNEIRLAIEPAAAALAARLADAKGKAAISAAIGRMQAAERGEDDALTSDIAFHLAVLQASGNRLYAQLSEFIETTLRFSIGAATSFKGGPPANSADHKKVSDAILACDAAAAETAMRAVVQAVLGPMLEANGGGRRLRGPDQDAAASPEYSARAG